MTRDAVNVCVGSVADPMGQMLNSIRMTTAGKVVSPSAARNLSCRTSICISSQILSRLTGLSADAQFFHSSIERREVDNLAERNFTLYAKQFALLVDDFVDHRLADAAVWTHRF